MSRSLSKPLALLFGLLFVAAGVGAAMAPKHHHARSAHRVRLAMYDDAEIFGHPDRAFPLLEKLNVHLVRFTLRWGRGPLAVALHRPAKPTDPADPAYQWGPIDQMMKRAAADHIKVIATIVGSPRWANGHKPRWKPPKKMSELRKFAFAAATRYSGSYVPPGATEPLPPIRMWLAWNEPNNPVFLRPQMKKIHHKWKPWSPVIYAKICNAVYAGVHATKIRHEKVGCGVTAPRGNNRGGGRRAAVSPLVFLHGLKKAGAHFDAYAHHPYYNRPTESPAMRPPGAAVTMGNIGKLLRELKHLYGGRKHLWITEYGYQTKPPDPAFGVSWKKQAKYLRQAYRIARKYKRIDVFTWFLLRDERTIGRWQSGLMTFKGKKKPAFGAFRKLAR